MSRSILLFGVVLAMAGSTPPARPSCAAALRQGRWETPGQNRFWLRCDGGELFWLGMNKASGDTLQGASWTNVGYGTIRGRTIVLRWADVPFGADTTAGHTEISILSDSTLAVSKDDGQMGKATWHWVGSR